MGEKLSLTESMDTRNTRPRKPAAGWLSAPGSITVAVWQPTLFAVTRGLGAHLERHTETGPYSSTGAAPATVHGCVKSTGLLTALVNLKSAFGSGQKIRNRPRPNLVRVHAASSNVTVCGSRLVSKSGLVASAEEDRMTGTANQLTKTPNRWIYVRPQYN